MVVELGGSGCDVKTPRSMPVDDRAERCTDPLEHLGRDAVTELLELSVGRHEPVRAPRRLPPARCWCWRAAWAYTGSCSLCPRWSGSSSVSLVVALRLPGLVVEHEDGAVVGSRRPGPPCREVAACGRRPAGTRPRPIPLRMPNASSVGHRPRARPVPGRHRQRPGTGRRSRRMCLPVAPPEDRTAGESRCLVASRSAPRRWRAAARDRLRTTARCGRAGRRRAAGAGPRR